MNSLFGFSLKDWVIVFSSTILVACLLDIQRLKKAIIQEVQRKFIPQLFLEMNETDSCFYLSNNSIFMAQNVVIEEVLLHMDEYGFGKKLTLKFDPLPPLRPKEKIRLQFKVYDKEFFLQEVTDKIFLHLVPASFKVKINYSNIENLAFSVTFAKEADKIHSEGIEYFQQPR
ncbi:MAG TPA: hypothetical protein P5110_02030 [Candidatus Omnitrophota bacterium]|nr:hypothetical protein [Candidatus Omnitrophota bacterium]